MGAGLTVYIRTDASEQLGIGHLKRMLHVATELKQRQHQVIFILATRSTMLDQLLRGFDVVYLNSSAGATPVWSEPEDARLSLAAMGEPAHATVIVDSYYLGAEWERCFKARGYQVVVFDDLANRAHDCDMLIDAKWCGESETANRYKGLVPETCIRLLGPAYCVLGAEYRQARYTPPEKFNVLFALGGGGDLAPLAALLSAMLVTVGDDDHDFCLQPVIGPLAVNAHLLKELAANDARVQPIIGAQSLCEKYLNSSLYVGALGTSVFELAALKVPALSFSIAENQENDLRCLEDFGHYLHLPKQALYQSQALAALIWSLRGKLTRLRALASAQRVRIDGLGCQRIVDHLLATAEAKMDGVSLPPQNVPVCHRLSERVSIRAVDDRDINCYLEARNLAQNRGNMLSTVEIERIDHYRWWFDSRRDSYLVSQDDLPMFYIWQQLYVFEQHEYWIGGWFVCREDCPFNLVLAALKWQLDETAKLKPNAAWVAVIKKSNKYVNLLNQYMGFDQASEQDEEFAAITHFFPAASRDEYNFVKYRP